ncbi:MAG TPA: ArsA-related P-loop ATPase [Candidatus Binataceae bacterium]|nr:ArsA-related P-loop ATPase [Candidatus Binataceae bacterium]
MTLPRLIFVTGKGGTGKSTVAAAMALALSKERPTTLADLDRRRSALRLLSPHHGDDGEKPYKLAGHLEGVALSPHAELEAFIERIVPVKALSRRMLQSRTFGYVTAALPGLEAFLMLDRLRIMAGDAALKDRQVVVDGPASGSALEFLSVAEGVKRLAPNGTLNRLASGVHSFLIDPARFGVAITVSPEEMALREALETAQILKHRLGIKWIIAILNATSKALFDAADLAALTPLKEHAHLALRRNAIAEYTMRAREQLKAAGLHVIELPTLFLPELGKAAAHQLAEKIGKAMAHR